VCVCVPLSLCQDNNFWTKVLRS